MSDVSNTHGSADVISWDIYEERLSDRSSVFNVVGTSDQCKVTFLCADENSAEELVALLDSRKVCGALAERLIPGARPTIKKCPRCQEEFPVDGEFFRPMAWCKWCESKYRTQKARRIRAALVQVKP